MDALAFPAPRGSVVTGRSIARRIGRVRRSRHGKRSGRAAGGLRSNSIRQREWQYMFTAKDISLFSAVNSRDILQNCLLKSPAIVAGLLSPRILEDYPSASIAYAEAIAECQTDIAVFVHQDIYLPGSWLDRFLAQINDLTADHPDWAVVGAYGVCADGRHVGRVWDVTIGRELGGPGFPATRVESLDEVLIAVRRTPGLDFDPALPRFHLYGTDIVQTARSLGRTSFVVEAPIVHHNRPIASLRGAYAEAYHYTRRKWRHRLPITTTICRLTSNPISLWKAQYRRVKALALPKPSSADPSAVSRMAGYE